MSYNGGKDGAGVWQKIISEIPPHNTLIIPFGGHCAITRRMRPCETTYLIEKDDAALRLWHGDERPGLRLIHGDSLILLPVFEQMGLLDDLTTFIFLDPPYPLSARRSPRAIYRHELSDDDHQQLLAVLTRQKCRVAISGYRHAIYEEALAHWRRIEFTTSTRGGHAATEVVWMNYPAPTELHDDRWLDFGQGWRERDRINKKVKRLRLKLRELPVLERRRLLAAALAETGDDTDEDPHAGNREDREKPPSDAGSPRGFSERVHLDEPQSTAVIRQSQKSSGKVRSQKSER